MSRRRMGQRPPPLAPTCPDHKERMVFSTDAPRPYYFCPRWPACDMQVSADAQGVPWGSVGGAADRRARIQAHRAFDPLWKGPAAFLTRGEAYAWLSEVMGMEPSVCHIRFMCATECQRVIELCSARMLLQYGVTVPEHPEQLGEVNDALLDAFDPATLSTLALSNRRQ
jgi:hypothetical protein